jgi:rfaE bifunctional protein nucleotidyltransferase chain/domain
MSPTIMNRESNFPAILSRDDAIRRCRLERLGGGTVVFTNGVFDLLHRGHLEYLDEARDMGSMLVVGLNSDASVRRIKGEKRPLMCADDRAYALTCLRSVDHVVLFDEDTPAKLIEQLNPHVLVKGGDYRPEDVVGHDHVTRSGGKVVSVQLRDGYSTSSFIQMIIDRYR